jgi:hypothetical protein
MWEFLLHRIFGVGGEPPERVRVGAGVVGHTTYALIGGCVAIGGICWALSHTPEYALGVAAIVAVLLVIFLLGTWFFANKHPDQAAMGGSEWRRFREAQIASKHHLDLPALPPISDPLKVSTDDPKLLDAPDEL